ncbi:hypothetical protein BU16DRAFT_91775 [Lophium mytilinum]|uniref:Uncharacterized protein n=1 Tax=Lophium mytilinum TaxID=390894 RepID=A0A6A6QK58_9PEZI|nr:hypothetical protein BU16DRAFT_91775 [Lophium mytilinum]
MVRAWTPPSIDPSSSLHITVSGMPTKKPYSMASKQKAKATKRGAVLGTSKSVEFRPASDGRGDRAGRVRYLSEEYCFKEDNKPKEMEAVIRPLERQRTWRRQEEELQGMFLSLAKGTQSLSGSDDFDALFRSRGRDGYNGPFQSRGRDGYNGPFHARGRDGYNGPFDCVTTEGGCQFLGLPQRHAQPNLPMERFLTSPEPWTHLSLTSRGGLASISAT